MSIEKIRQKNFIYLVDQYGIQKNAAAFLDKDYTLVNRWYKGTKNIGPQAARDIEESFAKYIRAIDQNPKDWLDLPHYKLWGEEEEEEPSSRKGGCDPLIITRAVTITEQYLSYSKIKLAPGDKGKVVSLVVKVYETSGKLTKETDEAITDFLSVALKNEIPT